MSGKNEPEVFARLWTYEEASEFLGIRADTLRHWVSAGKVPYIKIGGAVRFHPDQLNRWVLANLQHPDKAHGMKRVS